MQLQLLLLYLLSALISCSALLVFSRHQSLLSPSTLRHSSIPLHARISKTNDEDLQTRADEDASDKPISIPLNGVMGYEPGTLFKKPLSIYDPLKDTDSLPGEDGTEEKANAIKERIQDRIEELKRMGKWDEIQREEFGKNPLADIPLWKSILIHTKAAQPFESVEDLALTYVLVFVVTLISAGYWYVVSVGMDAAIDWYLRTDIDFISNIARILFPEG
jgi:hypothetical protein